MSDFKVSEQLKDNLLKIIYEAAWYWTACGHQTEHSSDLSLDEHEIEAKEVDGVVEAIVLEVLDHYDKETRLGLQLERIADGLEKISDKIPI